MDLKTYLAKHYVNIRGWKTNRKIVVIESDDWGSIRIPSLTVYNKLKELGYPLEKSKFSSLDGLEKMEDLELLFNILKSHKDSNDNYSVITALSLVANPDFDRIGESGFNTYYYQSLAETYKSYGEENLLEYWIESGIKTNLLYPQFHGREHLNPRKWLKVLKNDNKMELDAFQNKTLLGILVGQTTDRENYMSAFEAFTSADMEEVKKITIDGLKLFKSTFGFDSLSFMPSQSKQFEELNKTLVEQGVLFNQGGQYKVLDKNENFNLVNRFLGDIDQYGMTYSRRNCSFEPFKNQEENQVISCLKEIAIAFRCKKPAVISSHRINFTSRLSGENRDQSLEKLNSLLTEIVRKWPEVEFMNSEELGLAMLG